MYLHRWQLSTASTSTSHIFTDQHDQFWAKGSNQHQAAPAIGGEEEPHLFSTDPLFPLMITNSGLEGFRELLHIQLKLHDLVDLEQLPSPSLLFKLNRHNYSNLPWQSSHCTFSPFPSPPLQPLVLHVSRTVHNSRYGGITIVYRKKNNVTFHPHPDDIQFLLAPPNTSKNFKGKDQRQIPGAPQHWAEHKAAMVSCLAFFLP